MFGQSRFSIDVQKSIEQVQLGQNYKFNRVDTSQLKPKFYWLDKSDKTYSYPFGYPYSKGLDYDDFVHTVNTRTALAYTLSVLAGIAWGHAEIYHAYPDLLQRHYGATSTSWIGKNAWLRQYYEKNVDKGHKPEWGLNTFRDISHFTKTFHTFSFGVSVALIGTDSYPRKYKWIHAAGLFLIRSIAADLTYRYYSRFK